MTERTFRVFLGAGLFLLLYISAMTGRTDLIFFYIGLLVFEGVTNWRLPRILTVLKNKFYLTVPPRHESVQQDSLRVSIPFEAERAMRLVIAMILVLPLFIDVYILWIVPWFVASMLLLAGVTNICPMVMFFRWLGFK